MNVYSRAEELRECVYYTGIAERYWCEALLRYLDKDCAEQDIAWEAELILTDVETNMFRIHPGGHQDALHYSEHMHERMTYIESMAITWKFDRQATESEDFGFPLHLSRLNMDNMVNETEKALDKWKDNIDELSPMQSKAVKFIQEAARDFSAPGNFEHTLPIYSQVLRWKNIANSPRRRRRRARRRQKRIKAKLHGLSEEVINFMHAFERYELKPYFEEIFGWPRPEEVPPDEEEWFDPLEPQAEDPEMEGIPPLEPQAEDPEMEGIPIVNANDPSQDPLEPQVDEPEMEGIPIVNANDPAPPIHVHGYWRATA